MKLFDFRLEKQHSQIDFDNPIDISIPLRNGDDNPNCYFSDPPVFTPIEKGDFLGSVAGGGPCNHQLLKLSPHGNCTHTECYGHLSDNPGITINRCLKRFHFMAELVSVIPTSNVDGETKIVWSELKNRLKSTSSEALIIRTLPNTDKKLSANYSGENPAFFDEQITLKLAQMGILHLLVDLPSIDKENDGGMLSAHRAFWDFPENPREECTITELIYVPNSVPDGRYLLNLQIISLESDASPSKPVLYPVVNSS